MSGLMPWGIAFLITTSLLRSPDNTGGVSAEEREALVALYNATGGPAWVHRDRWLGPAGTECHWYGVGCGTEVSGELSTVQELRLANNGLRGRIPPAIGALRRLRWFILSDNSVMGPLPDVLLEKWDAGQLKIDPLSLGHDVEEVLVDVDNPALLCVGYKARMMVDGSVRLERRVCGEHNGHQTRKVHCEYRQGKIYGFDRLGRFLIRSGFFEDRQSRIPLVGMGQDIGEMNVTAKRRGGTHVSRSLNVSISDWSLSVMIDGIIANVEWAGPATTGPCSSK